MADSKDLKKTLETLSSSVKSIQDELATLKRGATHSGTDPQQSGSGMQLSSTDVAGLNPPPKRIKVDEEEANSDEEAEDFDATQGPLVPISESSCCIFRGFI